MMESNNNKKPPSTLSSTTINIPTTRQQTLNNKLLQKSSPPISIPIPTTNKNKKTTKESSSSSSSLLQQPIQTISGSSGSNNTKNSSIGDIKINIGTSSGNNNISIGSGSSSSKNINIDDNNNNNNSKPNITNKKPSGSPNDVFIKPSSAPSSFGGGLLSRMQQQQQQLLKNASNNSNNNNSGSGVNSITTTNSGFLRPVGIPTSSSFNQKSGATTNTATTTTGGSSSSFSSNGSMLSPRNYHNQQPQRNVTMSTSSDSSTSTSPNQLTYYNKQQSPNSYYSGFGIPSSLSSTSPSPTNYRSQKQSPSSSSSFFIRPSPPGSSYHTPVSSQNSFLMPSPQSASEVYGSKNSSGGGSGHHSSSTFPSLPIPPSTNHPKTKTIGFDIPSSSSSSTSTHNKNNTTSTTITPIKNRRRSSSLLAGKETVIPAHDLEFDSQDSDGSDGEDWNDEFEDDENDKDGDHDDEMRSPPPKETGSSLMMTPLSSSSLSTSSSSLSSSSTKGSVKTSFVNIENIDSLTVEKMVMEGWKKQIPRFHQKDAVVKIIQNIVEQFKIDSKKIIPLSPATPLSTPLSPLGIISAPSSTNSEYSNSSLLTSSPTTTTNTANHYHHTQHQHHQHHHPSQVIKPIKNSKNYLVQHAAGSGKSHTIACLITNLYRLLEEGKLKYDLILVLNDKRHLDTQLGSIIIQFLKDNDLSSISHPSTIALLEKILTKAKTRVVITSIQKFSKVMEMEENKFDQISNKYKSIAIISDDIRSMTSNLSNILTGETRENNNITYFCFTSTPRAKVLELFGDTRGNLRVPFHTYSIEKALQDKIVMNCIDHYSTVAFLKKVTTDGSNSSSSGGNSNTGSGNSSGDYFEENKLSSSSSSTSTTTATVASTPTSSSYHILNANDKKTIQEKSSYIIKHFVKLREQINNQDFRCRAMLVTSDKEQILLYKQALESIVKALPKSQRFDIIASFAKFYIKKKEKVEYDEKINGSYAEYFEKRNGITEILKNDQHHHRVQLIIVSDKLATGFDEPSLSIMYVDKALKGANAVQTIGRLSRVAKGKNACYIVDFINTRREISDAFGRFWREACLKGQNRKTVLELKLNRVLGKLSSIEPLANGRLDDSIDYILRDDDKRKKDRREGSITDEISSYFELCNQLLWDNAPPMNTKFLELVKYHVCEKRLNSQMSSIKSLLQNIENKSMINNPLVSGVSGSGSNNNNNNNASSLMNTINSTDVFQNSSSKKSNAFVRRQQLQQQQQIKQEGGGSEEMDLDAENLEFAREIWSSNPEIKLHSRLLGNDENEDEIDDIGFNLKMFESAETIEQVIEIVVEFVSKNGQTFENVIQNQSMAAIFPFIDPSDINYPIYKSKLDKARVKFNVEQQKLIQQRLKEQQHYKEQQLQHVQHLKEEQHKQMLLYNPYDGDIVMGEQSNNIIGQITFHMKTPWNNQDIPLPVPLPIVTLDHAVGKPHAQGKANDDCLLDDCILSFCNDLDTKDPLDAPVRVYAIQILGVLTNKGIHKNTLHEIVGSIHKILLNPKENISIKMVALDLLALVASQDEVTITQILDFGLISTIVKLIHTAEEPLKAKCCKFFSVLHNEVAIVSALIENQGISSITTLLESYDYLLVEQALRCLISLAQEDRTIKTIRTSIDPNVVTRLEHHKVQSIHDLINQLKSLISGSKRSLQQFQPLINNSKRIRSNSISQNTKLLNSSSKTLDLSKSSSSSSIIGSISEDNNISLSNSSPNISLSNNNNNNNLNTSPIINDDDDSIDSLNNSNNEINNTTTNTNSTTTTSTIKTRSISTSLN